MRKAFMFMAVFIVLTGIQSLSSPIADPESNETYVVVNSLKFAADRSLEPSPYLAYGTSYLYLILLVYGVMYGVGRLTGAYHDPKDFALEFLVSPDPFYLAGRVVSAAFAVGSLFVTFKIGEKFFRSRRIGYLASLLLFVNKVHFMRAQTVLPDTAVTFLSISLIYVLISISRGGAKRKDFIVAGMLSGFILGTKMNGAVSIAAVPVAYLMSAKENWHRWPNLEKILIFGVAAILSLFVVHPYFFLKFHEVTSLILQESDKARYVIKGEGGTPYFWIAMRLVKDNVYVGALYLAGIAYSFYRALRKDKDHILIMVPLVLYILVIGPQKIENMHFMLPAIPIVSLMASCAVSNAYERIHVLKHLRYGYILVLLILFLATFYESYGLVDAQWKPSDRDKAREWVERNVPPGSIIAMDSYENGPPILSVDRFFSAERLQDYREYAPAGLKERFIRYASKRKWYRTVRVNHYYEKPKWPDSFTDEMRRRFDGDLFMEREYRLDYRSLEELRRMGVRYVISTKDIDDIGRNPYSEGDLLHETHERKERFYESISREGSVARVATFGDIDIFRIRSSPDQ